MNLSPVHVRELAAWGFDAYPCRPSDAQPIGTQTVQSRPPFVQAQALAGDDWDWLRTPLKSHASRADLLDEMNSLDWSLDAIELRALISFQRRLTFDPAVAPSPLPNQDDAAALIACTFASAKQPIYHAHAQDARTLTLQSTDPNLQLRLLSQTQCAAIHCGSPFLEVARFRGRWFLRDGYHRAYNLLRHGVTVVPAVVVHARTLQELGAVLPRFFSEETLFSEFPPMVTDFLDDRLNLTYARPRLVKTIRLTVEESFTPEAHSGEPA
jgi:hypothetical protein